MYKLILLSIVISTIAIPMIAARDRNASRGLRIAILGVAAFNALYVAVIVLTNRAPFQAP